MSGKSLTHPFLVLFVIFNRASLIGLCPVLTILLDTRWYVDITLTWVLYLLNMCFLRSLFSGPPLKMIIGTICERLGPHGFELASRAFILPNYDGLTSYYRIVTAS